MASPLWKRILVFLGGPLANLVSALIAITLVLGPEEGLSRSGIVVLLTALSPILIASGQVPVGEISGPVGIIALSSKVAAADPLIGIGTMFVLLSIALGILNLFPIPALDGGQILMNVLVSLGMPRKWVQGLTYGSFTMLIIMMVWVTLKDVHALF